MIILIWLESTGPKSHWDVGLELFCEIETFEHAYIKEKIGIDVDIAGLDIHLIWHRFAGAVIKFHLEVAIGVGEMIAFRIVGSTIVRENPLTVDLSPLNLLKRSNVFFYFDMQAEFRVIEQSVHPSLQV